MATISLPRASSPAIPIITSPPPQSGSNTPTSSVRLSSELPPNLAGQPSSAHATEHQRRNRAALRDYYNLKSKAAATAGGSSAPSTQTLSRSASIKSTASDATHASSAATLTTNDGTYGSPLPGALDDPSFDAEAYITKLLKTSTLRDILKIESSLISEVRTLDGERKALVYDNYSKLIVAVGTIGEMQRGIVQDGQDSKRMTVNSINETDRGSSGLSRMKGLEQKLDDLMDGFQEVNRKQTSGTEGMTTQSTTQSIRDVRRKHALVQWVLDAPNRIKAMVEDSKQQEAESEWKEVDRILLKWDGVKGVSEVREACQQALAPNYNRDSDGESSGG